jgi:hypothetical protein
MRRHFADDLHRTMQGVGWLNRLRKNRWTLSF